MKIKVNLIGRCLPFVSALALYTNPASAQVNTREITENIRQVMQEKKLPGMAVVLVNSYGVIYKRGFGKADIEAAKSYTLSTTQEVGSVSKMILVVAMMKAIELGYFSLDTDINQILPYKVVNPHEPKHAITIRELATHTSGIIDNPGIYINTFKFDLQRRPYSSTYLEPLQGLGYKQALADTTLKQFFLNYLDQKGKYYSSGNFTYTPSGRTSSYSNIATALIAYLIEIKSGVSYKTFTKKYIFEPLHMSHSAWFTAEVKLNKLAQLYHDGGIRFPLYDLATYPDGGLKTNALDLSRFLVDMINGLSGKSRVLKAQSFQTMFTPQFSGTNLPAGLSLAKRNKGILWNLYNNGTIGHDGDDPGVSSFLVFNPATGLGGLFLCNKYMDDKSPITNIITKSISKPLKVKPE